MTSTQKSDFFPLICCLLLIAIAYLPTFSGEFILDDRPFVKENPYIQRFHGLTSYLTQEDGISSQASDGRHSGYYRPLISLSYTLDLKIWGMNPGGFRTTNLLLHLLTCLVLYAVLRRFNRSGLSLCLAVLLFGLHPAHTESVSWVTSRNNILVAFFALTALYCYVRGEQDANGLWRVCSWICFGLALLCKEFAVMMLPILICYDQFVVKKREPPVKRGVRYIPFLALIVGYFLLRSMAIPEIAPPRGSVSWWQAVYYMPFIIMYNLRIVFFPYGLHNFNVSYPESYLGAEALTGIVGLGTIAWLLWHFRQHAHVLFAVFSFLLALFPVLHIVPTSATSLISMRWLYFPMIFFVFTAETGIRRVMKTGRHFFVATLLVVIILYMGIYTYFLNDAHWKREENFFKNEVLLFDNRFYESDFARMLHKRGDFPGAIAHYKKALKVDPRRADTYINFASLLVEMERLDEALAYLRRAEHLPMAQKDLAAFYNNKGVAYFRKRAFSEAIDAFQRASSAAPNELSYLNNLGLAYLEAERYGEAVNVLENCLRLEPNQWQTRKHLGLAYARNGEVEKAQKVLAEIPAWVVNRDPSIQKTLMDMKRKKRSPGE